MKLFFMTAAVCYSTFSFAAESLPVPKDYPAQAIYKGKSAKVDFAKNPRLRKYRTRLSDGIQEGANFAGHYSVIEVGCGTGCQIVFILDAKTGQSVKVGKNSAEGEFAQTCFGVFHQVDSNLLILNPPEPGYEPMCAAKYYVLKGQQLKRLK